MSDPQVDRRTTPLPPSTTTTIILSTTPPTDPPPPYPARGRHSGRRRRRPLAYNAVQGGEADHLANTEDDELSPPEHDHFPSAGDDSGNEYDAPPHPEVASENPPIFLQVPNPPSIPPPTPRLQVSAGGGSAIGRRPRTLSVSSTLHSAVSAAPSFAQTVLSAFHPDQDEDLDPTCAPERQIYHEEAGEMSTAYDVHIEDEHTPLLPEYSRFGRRPPAASSPWYRYFRPMFKRAYYSALFHLLILNFPYALAAWVYLFVFTLTGTTTLMALPVGALLCFLDLLGARTFARGELSIQTTFHGPLAYPDPSPPHPIFTRVRAPTPAEMETGVNVVYERSFYRNAYSMFTDSTSYQSLFYFLVIKPGITVLLFLTLAVLVPVCFVLILPAPAILRLVRRLGIWQANVAVEGLWLVVR